MFEVNVTPVTEIVAQWKEQETVITVEQWKEQESALKNIFKEAIKPVKKAIKADESLQAAITEMRYKAPLTFKMVGSTAMALSFNLRSDWKSEFKEASEKMVPFFQAFHDAARLVYDIKEQSSARFAKRNEKKVAEEKVFSRYMSLASVQKLETELTGIADRLKDEYIAGVADWFMAFIPRFEEFVSSKEKENSLYYFARQAGTGAQIFLQKAVETENDYRGFKVLSVNVLPNAREIAVEMATENFNILKFNYVNKNIHKLAPVIEKKEKISEMVKINVSYVSTNNRSLDSQLSLIFKDGSSFDIVNKVISKVSNQGTWFNQYPTTFHTVRFASGEKLSSPCEYSVNTDWAVK